jgi:hypothetical protein
MADKLNRGFYTVAFDRAQITQRNAGSFAAYGRRPTACTFSASGQNTIIGSQDTHVGPLPTYEFSLYIVAPLCFSVRDGPNSLAVIYAYIMCAEIKW